MLLQSKPLRKYDFTHKKSVFNLNVTIRVCISMALFSAVKNYKKRKIV